MEVLLKEFKANANMRTSNGYTPLHHLVVRDGRAYDPESSECKVAELLIQHGADPNCESTAYASKAANASPRAFAEQFSSSILTDLYRRFIDAPKELRPSAENCIAVFSKKDTLFTTFKYQVQRNLTQEVALTGAAVVATALFVSSKFKH
jgi:ankyrin repeat protein